MPSMQASRPILFLLLLVMAGAAFALGIGVTALLDDDAGDAPAGRAPAFLASAADDGRATSFSLLDEVFAILEEEFVEPDRVALQDLRVAAINGIVDSLNDPHSVYLDEETFRLSSEDIGGEFEGIGASVNQQGDQIIIASVFRNSPAERSGIRSGDVILAIDGVSTEGWSLQLTVATIRGPADTPVEITVRHRNGVEETIRVIRSRIIIPSVDSIPINDRSGVSVTDIGYIAIRQFTNQTRGELLPLLEAARSVGLTQLILDVRGNPGGLLRATVETTGEFLDANDIVLTQVDRDGSVRNFGAQTAGIGLDFQLVVLVDGGSASGAEAMAAALRDHGRAVIIGEQSIGKGTVNIPRRLSDGSVLYISIARWLSPAGSQIEGVGVIPDIIVEPTDQEFEQRLDVALFAAIDYLRGQDATAVG